MARFRRLGHIIGGWNSAFVFPFSEMTTHSSCMISSNSSNLNPGWGLYSVRC
jgi:hypothetical protein